MSALSALSCLYTHSESATAACLELKYAGAPFMEMRPAMEQTLIIWQCDFWLRICGRKFCIINQCEYTLVS